MRAHREEHHRLRLAAKCRGKELRQLRVSVRDVALLPIERHQDIAEGGERAVDVACLLQSLPTRRGISYAL